MAPQTIAVSLFASAVAPAAAAAGGPAAAGAAVLAQLGAVGAGYATNVLDRVITKLREQSAPAASAELRPEVVRDAVAGEVLRTLDAGGYDAAKLRADIALVLREVGGAKAALEAAVDARLSEVQEQLVHGFITLGSEFLEFAWMLGDVRGALDALQEEVAQQGAEQRQLADMTRRMLAVVTAMRAEAIAAAATAGRS